MRPAFAAFPALFPALSPALLAALLIGSQLASAHELKPYDLNGGHWDDAGFYHCHLSNCVPTASRNQFRSRAFTNPRDIDLYYLKEDWPYWLAPDGGCKTMRTIVLESTSKVPVTYSNPRQCEVREGLWVDEYTGEEYTRAGALEIDHIVPPKYANASNGYQWDLNKRAQFANDPINLIPVGRDTARKKNERSIGDWRPREEFTCEYAKNWRQVAEKYDLDLFARDTSRINSLLEKCGEDVGPAVQEEAAVAPPNAPEQGR
jgi:hypothetical protein